MKTLSTNQTLFAAGLTYTRFDNEDEADAVAELVGDLGLDNVIITPEGFYSLTADYDELRKQLDPYLVSSIED
jgi:hypothetical protein